MSTLSFFDFYFIEQGETQDHGTTDDLPQTHGLFQPEGGEQDGNKRIDVAQNRHLLTGQVFHGGEIHAVGKAGAAGRNLPRVFLFRLLSPAASPWLVLAGGERRAAFVQRKTHAPSVEKPNWIYLLHQPVLYGILMLFAK